MKIPIPSQISALFLCAALLPGVSLAQSSEKKAKGWLRILPVGDAPPWMEVEEGGVRKQVSAPVGSVPPFEVKVPEQEGEENEPVRLNLNSISSRFVASVGSIPLSDPEGPAGEAWHTLKMPARSSALAVLWRDPEKKKWTTARSLMLPDDTTAFPGGRVRILNISKYPIGVRFQGKGSGLAPGKMVMAGVKGQALKDAPFEINIPNGKGGWKRIFDRAITQSASERTNIIIYTADGVKPLRPAQVFIRRERAVIPPMRRRNN